MRSRGPGPLLDTDCTLRIYSNDTLFDFSKTILSVTMKIPNISVMLQKKNIINNNNNLLYKHLFLDPHPSLWKNSATANNRGTT